MAISLQKSKILCIKSDVGKIQMVSDRWQFVVMTVAVIVQETFGIDDAIGWLLFILGIILLGSLIRFFWSLADYYFARGRNTVSDEDLFDRIAALNAQIKRVEKDKDAMMARFQSQIDDLKKQRNALEEEVRQNALMRKRLQEEGVNIPEGVPDNMPVGKDDTPLLVATGKGAELTLDYSSARGVETETGMKFRRIDDVTFPRLKDYLDKARVKGRPYTKLHLSVHGDPLGIYMNGELIEGQRLSEILRGVKVMVIAGCETSEIADYLSVVPKVVSMSKKVMAKDAMFFARAFWTQIGLGIEPEDALEIALERSPSGMSEYVEYSW